jgi:FeS assembly protein IscX
MPQPLTWNDADEIGISLSRAHPETEPLSVRIPDLRRLVTQLSDFHDDPKKSNEAQLHAIQQAWLAEYLDRTQS